MIVHGRNDLIRRDVWIILCVLYGFGIVFPDTNDLLMIDENRNLSILFEKFIFICLNPLKIRENI